MASCHLSARGNEQLNATTKGPVPVVEPRPFAVRKRIPDRSGFESMPREKRDSLPRTPSLGISDLVKGRDTYTLEMTTKQRPKRPSPWPWSEWWPWVGLLILLSMVALFLLNIAYGRCGDSVLPGESFCEEYSLIAPDARPIFFSIVAALAMYFLYRIVQASITARRK